MDKPSVHIVFTVVNDLNYDQRMQRISKTLWEAGYEVTLIGRVLPHSLPLDQQPYHQKRLSPYFEKGKLFYIEYNLRLLWHLLWHRYDIFSAVDLDTVMPHYLISTLKGRPFVYDAHEYFPEVPEVVNRPKIRKVWEWVEQWVVPRANAVYTVSRSIAAIFYTKYQKKVGVIRNISHLQQEEVIPYQADRPYIIYQGAVNVGRGLMVLIAAMQYIDCDLFICGKGDVWEECVAFSKTLGLDHQVHFLGQVAPQALRPLTAGAVLGFNAYEPHQGVSYYLSLANRFFDYLHAGIPQICSNYPEYQRLNAQYEVAVLLDELRVEEVVRVANRFLVDKELWDAYHQRCLVAKQVLNWQEEGKKVVAIYEDLY